MASRSDVPRHYYSSEYNNTLSNLPEWGVKNKATQTNGTTRQIDKQNNDLVYPTTALEPHHPSRSLCERKTSLVVQYSARSHRGHKKGGKEEVQDNIATENP